MSAPRILLALLLGALDELRDDLSRLLVVLREAVAAWLTVRAWEDAEERGDAVLDEDEIAFFKSIGVEVVT